MKLEPFVRDLRRELEADNLGDVLEQDDGKPAGERTPSTEKRAQPLGDRRMPRPA